MKINSKTMASGALAALCLTLGGGLRAADQQHDNTKDSTKSRTERSTRYETKVMEGQPAKFNKASSIIGMDVRNHRDERLGEIKDIVFDLRSEKVAYAVLGTGGLLDRQKFLAVPLNAFTPSADQKHLILRAEKSKLETAMGFEKDSWPHVSNPSWGAEFWEKPTTEHHGTTTPPHTQPETKPENK